MLENALHDFTRKGVSFKWDQSCEDAFLELNRRLTSTPILVAPCDEGTYVLDADASDTAFGARACLDQHLIVTRSREVLGDHDRDHITPIGRCTN